MTDQPVPKSLEKTPASDSVTGSLLEEMRKCFRAFVNDDTQFRKFIKSCNESTRDSRWLKSWQLDLWASFINRHAEFAENSPTAIIDAFHLCHVHLANLRQVEVPIRKGVWCMTHAGEIDEQITSNAPYSVPYALDSSAWGEATHTSVDHCDECLEWRNRMGV